MKRIRSLSVSVLWVLSTVSLFGQTTYMNPVGTALGSSHGVFDDQFLGTRFQFTDALHATSITADFTVGNDQNLFVAIVALDNLSDSPTASSTSGLADLDEVVFTTLFNPGTITLGNLTTITIPIDVQLPAGSYAVVFGGGLFGSPGGTGGANGGLQNYNLITGSDTIAWTAPSVTWGGPQYDLIANGTPTYGISIIGTITAIPEPAVIGLFLGAMGLAAASTLRRRKWSGSTG